MNWVKSHKKTVAVIVLVLILIGAASSGSSNKNEGKNVSNSTNAPSQKASNKQPNTGPEVTYQTVKNTDSGSQITLVGIIDASNNNSNFMPALCNKLHQAASASADKFYFADFYDTASAANNRDKVLNDSATPSEIADYDAHYVLTYKHNPTTAYNQCTITYKGDADPNPQIIKY